MALAFSTGYKNKSLDRNYNGGTTGNFDSGTLTIRSGSAPGPDAAPTGTVIATITLPADAFNAASSGSVTLNGTWQDTSADNSGTAAHFRLVKSGDGGGSSTTDERVEGTVTASGGGGDMIIQNTSVNSGQAVTITTFTLTHP